MDRVAEIRCRLEESLTPSHLEVTDVSHLHIGHPGAIDSGGHFSVTVVTDQFANKTILQRHRMVYDAVNDLMPTEIHALSIKALSVADE